jgi:hypothetical protein
MKKPPAPSLLFGPLRFQVQAPQLDELVNAFGKIRDEAYTKMNQQVPLLQNIGLNTEHEWQDARFRPAKRWLADRYVKKGLHSLPSEADVIVSTVSFHLELRDPNRQYNVQLPPRAEMEAGEIEDGVYAIVNDHRDWNKGVPSNKEVAALLEESANEVKARVSPLLVGGVADA